MGQAREKDDDLVALAGLLAFGEVEMVAIELGEVLAPALWRIELPASDPSY